LDRETDRLIRMAAFDRLEELSRAHGDVLPCAALFAGFEFRGRKVAWISQQGIVKPAGMDMALSITTSPDDPYGDTVDDDGFIAYRYQGTDPEQWDNVAMRRAGVEGVPLVYFHGVASGQYKAFWPAFIQHDDPAALTVSVAIDQPQVLRGDLTPEIVDEVHRRYTTQLARKRLHQTQFRERVLTAYASRCAICRLRHRELLDAAHILGDSHPKGAPVVPNGLSLCKIHHSAFDANIVGIRPDYVLEVRTDALHLPKKLVNRPNPDFLEERYDEFRAAG